jgi:hypothetical protein
LAGYQAIKASDGAAKVLIGETVPYAQGRRAMAPVKFLRKMACVNNQYRRVRRCPKLKADGYAHHPYDKARELPEAGPAHRRKNRRVKEVVQYLLVQPNDGSPFTTGIISSDGVATPSFAVLRGAA